MIAALTRLIIYKRTNYNYYIATNFLSQHNRRDFIMLRRFSIICIGYIVILPATEQPFEIRTIPTYNIFTFHPIQNRYIICIY